MQELEKMQNWLKTYPGWDPSWEIHLDCTDGNSRNPGLFSRGLEVKNRKTDLIGNVTVYCLYRFQLLLTEPDREQAAKKILDFQNWVGEQSAMGLTPAFGDDPAGETMTAEKGRLAQMRRPGTSFYQVGLTARFTKHYEVK